MRLTWQYSKPAAGPESVEHIQAKIGQIDEQMEHIEKQAGFGESPGIRASLSDGLIEWEDCAANLSKRLKREWFKLAHKQQQLDNKISVIEQHATLKRALQQDDASLRALTWSITNDLGIRDSKRHFLLAFQAVQDNRPPYLESVIVAVEFIDGKWELAHAYRNSTTDRWKRSQVYDVPYTSCKEYDHVPTRREVAVFLTETWWDFDPKQSIRFKGYEVLSAQVFSEEWQAAFGYQAHQLPTPV